MIGLEPTKGVKVPGLNLSRAEAKERADHLYVNSYVVTLDVTKGEETFYAKSEVSFTCNKPGYSTFIDAVGRSVISATLNGVAVDTSNFDGESIFLTNLAADNLLVIEIEAEYSKSGEGLQRSVDPSDGSTERCRPSPDFEYAASISITRILSAARLVMKIDSPSKLLVSTGVPLRVALITERPTASINVE
jgi:hypothetical protein